MDVETLTQALLEKLFIPLEASGRHVHLTEAAAQTLFGHSLTPQRALSQPGQYLARERVTLRGPKGEFQNVAVLGPARKDCQVEISLTDGRALGISPPVRASGDVAGSPGITIYGPCGEVNPHEGVICAQRHLHLTPQDAQRFQVKDKQVVSLETFTRRPVVFRDVLVRVSPDFATTCHLDFDEANACGFALGDLGRILP